MNKYFLYLIILIAFISCKPSTHFEEKIRFVNNNWNKFNELNFDIPVEAGKSYNFKGNIITDSSYLNRKMEIGFYLFLPNGENRLEDQIIRILDYEYQPLGEKTEEGIQLAVNFKDHLIINESGILKVQIVFHSEKLDNFGIIGIDLFVFEH